MTCGAVFQSRAAPNKGCSKSLAEFRRRSGERKSRSFSSATCAAKKIPLGLQTCVPSAKADGACAAAGRKPFRQKSTTFLTKTTPQAIACGVSAQLVQKPRRVSPPERRKKVRSFSSATCAAEKIPLGLQTCAPSAKADGACAAAGRKPFRQKSTTFLTKTTPQAIACGVASL